VTLVDRIQPLYRQTLGERVHAELGDLLMSGHLAPGARISIRGLAEQLGVSATPVRDAVGRLADDGALIVLPNRAVLVPIMTAGQLRELATVRTAVEGFAAARAAAARSEADLRVMARHDAAFRALALAPEPDVDAMLRSNLDLHFAVYGAAGLPTLVSIIRPLWLRIGPALNLCLRGNAGHAAARAARHHRDLLAAIAARDEEGARAALALDIESAAAFIASRLG
jgi:DNA-binding GntR family transcriptional regulator